MSYLVLLQYASDTDLMSVLNNGLGKHIANLDPLTLVTFAKVSHCLSA